MNFSEEKAMSECVTSKTENGTLFIMLSGRIDSANASQTEAQINGITEAEKRSCTVIDASALEYISSAGLRVILRLKKSDPTLKIINACPEVYDILDMTGFTEMMTVEKAYRRISVEGKEIIGRGSNGAVYRLDPETIIKVYPNADALEDIRRERELARRAFVLGIPTAIPYDVVRVDDGYGSVFELLNAKSLTKILIDDPSKIDEVAAVYVELLKKIHSTKVRKGDMPDMKTVAVEWVNDIKSCLPAQTFEKLSSLINGVPENLHMIHGDYHTKNIMVQNGEALLIDMDTLCCGDPVFEFASIFNAYIGFYSGRPAFDGPSFIGISYEAGVEIWNRTLRLYFGTDDGDTLKKIENKASLVGYVRVLRRTLRRIGTSRPEDANAVEYLKKEIIRLTDAVDTLAL